MRLERDGYDEGALRRGACRDGYEFPEISQLLILMNLEHHHVRP